MVTCSNQSSHEWIRKTVPRIKWNGISPLKILVGNELPRLEVMIVNPPDCSQELNEKILRRMRAQNVPENWKVES